MSELKSAACYRPETRLVHSGTLRSQFCETSEALFLTQGFVYDSAEQCEARFKGEDQGFLYSRFSNPTTRMFETVQDGVLQRSWCIIPGDPPGTYTYDITIDGEPRGEFVFCAIEVPDQNPNTDPRELTCPNKFNSVERVRPQPDKAS